MQTRRSVDLDSIQWTATHAWLIGLGVAALVGVAIYVSHTSEKHTGETASAPHSTPARQTEVERRRVCQSTMAQRVTQANKLIEARSPSLAIELLDECAGLLDDAATAARARAADAKERNRLALARTQGVSIGMTQAEALESAWGKPSKVNRTTTANIVTEQWVYPGGYLYFTNGKLTAIQN